MLLLSVFVSCLLRCGLAATHELGDSGEPCEPGVADTCFTSVSQDLRYMLRLGKDMRANVSAKAVLELCLALDDALNCTSDVIDDGCSDSEGRDSFDAWLRALRAALRFVCAGAERDKAPIRDILLGRPCWDLRDFVSCAEREGNLTHVRDLLHTRSGGEECGRLKTVTSGCFRAASNASCREQEEVTRKARDMLAAFLVESGCSRPAAHGSAEAPAGAERAAAALPAALCALLLLAMLALRRQ